ncbi:VCBS repeat-containing protein [Spirosoma sp. BT702]|uniref:VCBS repeat-containing protein n=1 Tax=Spirosoma profusum TaxID=2771354 RepID=A0A927GAR1_9BACT|nr:VCBS repeat-containing protein [Spirosoma profusum]
MLTANFGNSTVSVRLNNGSGNFTAPAINPNPAVELQPYSVALGDVDGDGDLDLLTANASNATVSVRLNDGSGNFTPPATNPKPGVGSTPYSVALGDVDGDGDLDFVTANFSSSTVSVRLNNGSGNFTAPATNPDPAVGDLPYSVALGDVDGDGDLDFVTANSRSSTGSVRLNGPLVLTLTNLLASPTPVCAGQLLAVTASVSNFSGSYSYTLSNGSAPLSGTATTSAFSQSLTVTGSGVQTFTLTVSSQGQVATATTSVTVPSLYSVKAGEWTDGSVWSCGRVPLIWDTVTLHHAVSLPATYQGQALWVIYSTTGRLTFGGGSGLRLGGN